MLSLSTKLLVPRLGARAVVRARLHRRLERGTELILVSAPAGSGKSTLLASWLREQARPVAWLSLDAGDNDLGRFLLYLVGALQKAEPEVGSGLLELLQTQASVQPEPVIIRLINSVAAAGRDLLLVLDDYHVITNTQVHAAVDFLLDHLPPRLGLAVASRADPPLALARLRVRGQLTELRAADLRFSAAEADAFLNGASGLELSPDAVARLEARTEGWAAGLQLAALSLAGRDDKEAFVEAFAGTHHYLVDYLMAEVLARQTPETRRFLQRTSVLERFTGSLCEAVSGQADGLARLEGLASANLFLIPLDETRTWYRYHHLFAEFLRHDLRKEGAALVPELHRRASAWLEQRGLTEEAFRHAVLADDPARAAGLVQAVASELVIQGRAPQLLRYAEELPAALLPGYPVLLFYLCCALSDTGQFDRLPPLLRLLGERPDSVLAAASRATFAGILCLHRLEFAAAARQADEAAALLEPHLAVSGGRDEGLLLAAATNLRTLAALRGGQLAEAERAYPVALERSQRAGNQVGAMSCFARWGRVKHLQGELYGALDLYRRGLDALEGWAARGGPGGVATTQDELYLNLAALYYEWNRLDEAEHYLERARAFNERSQYPPALAQEIELTFCLRLARGHPGAGDLIDRLDRLISRLSPDNRLDRLAFGTAAMRLRLRALREAAAPGLLTELRGWTQRLGLRPRGALSYAYEGAYFVLAELSAPPLGVGEAPELLARLVRAAEAGGRVDDLIRYRTGLALAYERLGRRPEATRPLRAALELAAPQGYVRSFIDVGRPVETLLRAVATGGVGAAYARELLAALPAEAERLGGSAAEPKAEPDGPEPLSERERDVLRLLAAGHANKEIAKALGLSPNTVRWYVSSLLGKLQVSSRLGAVGRARELGLL